MSRRVHRSVNSLNSRNIPAEMTDDQSTPLCAPTEGEVQSGFIVHGRVQGVGFRWWTRRLAMDLGLAGSVRNRREGTVEVRARGPASSMQRLAEALRRGPASASVERVERFDPGEVAAATFEIEP